MGLKDELESKVNQIFREQWEVRKGQSVPISESLKLSNDAVKLDGVVLYADMSESTNLVESYKSHFAAEIYKSYLHCAAKIIKSHNGEITAYDGDRIMAVFIGDTKNTSAVKAAMKISAACRNIINPAIRSQYPSSQYEIKHTVGIDSCELFVARTGIRGSNDLVWVGNAANHAAKLCNLPNTHPIRITDNVYKKIAGEVKYSGSKNMWEKRIWKEANLTIHRTNYFWPLS